MGQGCHLDKMPLRLQNRAHQSTQPRWREWTLQKTASKTGKTPLFPSLPMKLLPRLSRPAVLLAAALSLAPAAVRAQTPVADYRFNNTYNNSVGTVGALTPTYTDNTFATATVNGVSQTVLNVPNTSNTAAMQNGVQTPANPFANQGNYSIVLLANFTSSLTGNANTVSKVFDFASFTSDAGLYINNNTGLFQFADGTGAPVAGGTSTAGVLVTGTYYQLTLTRSSATNVVTAYQNGTQAFQFTDTTGLATLNTMLSLYRDDGVGTAAGITNEGNSGNLARLRLYNAVLNQAQVAALVPEPSAWALLGVGGGLLGVVVFRRRRTA